MALKKYLYREDEALFFRLEQLQKILNITSLRQVLTLAVIKGIEAYCKENNWTLESAPPPKESIKQTPFVLTEE